MSTADEITEGSVCRLCGLPLQPPHPGYTRVCEECWTDAFADGYLEEHEEMIGAAPIQEE